jgi:hypothetical protein
MLNNALRCFCEGQAFTVKQGGPCGRQQAYFMEASQFVLVCTRCHCHRRILVKHRSGAVFKKSGLRYEVSVPFKDEPVLEDKRFIPIKGPKSQEVEGMDKRESVCSDYHPEEEPPF